MAKVTFYLDTRKAVEGDIFPLVLNLAHKCQMSNVTYPHRYAFLQGGLGSYAAYACQ